MCAITQLLAPEEWAQLDSSQLDTLECYLEGHVMSTPELRSHIEGGMAVNAQMRVGCMIAANILNIPEARSQLAERARTAYEAMIRAQSSK
jgi:hypothetical protein